MTKPIRQASGANGSQTATPPQLCSEGDGGICYNYNSVYDPSDFRSRYYAIGTNSRVEEILQANAPEKMAFPVSTYFLPGVDYSLTGNNLSTLSALHPEMAPYLPQLTGQSFSFSEVGTVVTTEGIEMPVSQLTFHRSGLAEPPSLPLGSRLGGPGGSSPNPKFNPNGAGTSMLYVGGYLLFSFGLDQAMNKATDQQVIPKELQGTLMFGTSFGTAAGISYAGSKIGMMEWKGMGNFKNSWVRGGSYFTAYQAGAAYLFDLTGFAKYGTDLNTYGSMGAGALPFVVAKFVPKFRPFVGLAPEVGAVAKASTGAAEVERIFRVVGLEGGTAGSIAAETTLFSRGLGAASRAVGLVGEFLMVDWAAGQGVAIGNGIIRQIEAGDPNAQAKEERRKLRTMVRDQMMSKDLGIIGGFSWTQIWADVGTCIAKVVDGDPGPDPFEKQVNKYIDASKEFGEAMRSALIELAAESMDEKGFDSKLFQKKVHDLYQGKQKEDIQTAYSLLSTTSFFARDASSLLSGIDRWGNFANGDNGVLMSSFVSDLFKTQMKKDFAGFMEDRLLQFARLSLQGDGQNQTIDWSQFQKRVSDFYDFFNKYGGQDMAKSYEAAAAGNDHRSQMLIKLIGKDGAVSDPEELKDYLAELTKNRYDDKKDELYGDLRRLKLLDAQNMPINRDHPNRQQNQYIHGDGNKLTKEMKLLQTINHALTSSNQKK